MSKRPLKYKIIFFVYVLGICRKDDRRTYVGWTTDRDRRLKQHNEGVGAKSTRGRKWILLYSDLAPIDRRTRRSRLAWNRKQPPFELWVVETFGHRPGDADHAGTPHVLPDHRLTDARRLADLPEAHPKRVLEPQHVTHLAHRQSLRWHREPRFVAGSLITRFDRRRERRSARPHRLSAIIGMLSGLRRNPVRNPSDSAFMVRNSS